MAALITEVLIWILLVWVVFAGLYRLGRGLVAWKRLRRTRGHGRWVG